MGSTGKDKVVDSELKVTKYYSTRGFEKKMIEDALKANKLKP